MELGVKECDDPYGIAADRGQADRKTPERFSLQHVYDLGHGRQRLDGCTPLSPDLVVIESVKSDEADDAPGKDDGFTVNDIVIASNCQSVQLRAERDNRYDGRVYLVTLRLTGNSAAAGSKAVFRVEVPLLQGGTATAGSPVLVKLSNCQP